jgi:serine/threonine protein kinase
VTPATPSQIGKYEVIEVLGRGGMGVVYLGFDRQLGRQVAIKTLTEGFVQDPEMLKRFYREATKTGALMHPNIVIVYDLGEQDGFPYIVMEYVSGEPLDKIIQSGRPLSLVSKLRVMEQVCLALGYAHRNDVIHRDVKPANVIVQQDDNAKLLDFGIAHHEQHDRDHRLTKAGNILGTMQYMAPERWRGEPFDGRSDIFSAGVMLYELLAGHLPYHGEDVALFHQILHEPPPPLSKYVANYPVALDVIIQRALAKNPNDRYGNAEEMAAEIAAVAEHLRKEQGAEMFQRAEQFVHAEDYLRARDLLSQLIKLDSKNVDARKLLATVQSNLAVRQRAEQVQQLKLQADDAFEEKLYPQAIAFLEQALRLDPADAEAQQKVEGARQKKRVRDEIEDYLRKADGAREMRQFEPAQALLQKAMHLDPSDSRVKAAWHTLNAQIEEDAKQRKVKQILDSAQAELRARRFTAATQLLQEAVQTDPGNAEIVRLLQSTKTAQEQERRRKFVEQIQNEASSAVTAPQIAAASQKVEKALQQMPDEPAFLKLKAQLDRQLKDLQVRAKVDETVQRCYPLMESAPQQALALVQERLRELPSEERLLILQSAIEERLAQLKLEEARSRYMARAHEAIRSQRYREAVQVLEACHSEGVLSDEVTDLLEFARHEARREERSALIETTAAKAQALISQGSYDQVISLLEPVVAQYDDPSLKVVLEKARSERHSEQLRLQSVLATLQQLTSFQQWEEAITFLDQQPAAVRENDAVKSALVELREASDREGRILQAAGAAYAALHRADLPAAHQQAEAVRRVQDPSELATRLVSSLEARVTVVADHVVARATSEARSALQERDPKRAVEVLADSSAAKDYSTPDVRQDWQALKKQAGRAKLLSRVGIR